MNRILNTFNHKNHATFLYRASGGGINQVVQTIGKRHPQDMQHRRAFE
jgi:hypothetical protein